MATAVGVFSVSSGPKASGAMGNYSDWYYLSTPPLDPGFFIKTWSWKMTGDRDGHSWSDTEYTAHSAYQIAMRFRMQGHNDVTTILAKNQGVAKSELTITYTVAAEAKAPPP